jgi:alpha-mannosidase
VQICALKFAEDGRGVILRLVESAGAGDDVTIRWNIPARTVSKVDLLEHPLARGAATAFRHDGSTTRGVTRVSLRPFEILTLRAQGTPTPPRAGARRSRRRRA